MSDPLLSLRPVAQRRAFEEILQQLEEAIAAGHLAAGARLPSERDLATRFQVSRTSVREALRVLEALGIVRVRRGADHGATLREEAGNAFTHLFRFQLALRHISIESLIEFRVMIETWAADSIERTPRPELLRELEKLVVQMEQDRLEQPEFHSVDTAFHMTIVRASKNELATLFVEGCWSAIRRIMLRAIMDVEDWPAASKDLAREHREILTALASKESAKARELLADHIRRWGRRAAQIEAQRQKEASGSRAARP